MLPRCQSLREEGQDDILGDCEGRAEDSRVVGGEHRQEEQEAEAPEESDGQDCLHRDGEAQLVEEGTALLEGVVGLALRVDQLRLDVAVLELFLS